jgi:FMN-dependent NADH-azoreductase
MNILHIDCSPRQESHSRRLSEEVVGRLLALFPQGKVIRRDLGHALISHATPEYAAALATPASIAATAPSSDALRLSEQLIRELEDSDVIVIGTPMNNLTIPSVLKAWLDQVLRVGRTIRSTPEGKVGMLRDRPVFVGIASGAVFAGGHARQPDFLTPYLAAALGSIGLATVNFLPLQATASISEARAAELRRSLVESIEPLMLRLEAVPDEHR